MILIYKLPETISDYTAGKSSLSGLPTTENQLHLKLENAISRNGKSLCAYEQFIAYRNLKAKCFEIIDVRTKKSMLQFAYEDIWYYNNYHVLGHIFVFPHYMKVTFFDSTNGFKKLQSQGVDFDWYKNDDNSSKQPSPKNIKGAPGNEKTHSPQTLADHVKSV